MNDRQPPAPSVPLTRGQIEDWLASIDDYGMGDGRYWIPTKEGFEKLCNLALSSIIFGMMEPPSETEAPKRLWLWKNFVDGRPEYWAFDNPYPCVPGGGDPLTLGEPCGYAIVKDSTQGRTDVSDDEVIAAIKRASSASATRTTGWRLRDDSPTADDLYIVRDADGQLGFAHYERGKWLHTPDQDLGCVSEWCPLPVESRPEEKDTWIEWTGGKCPLPMVEVMLRDGTTMIGWPDSFSWNHDREPYGRDIVGYRLYMNSLPHKEA